MDVFEKLITENIVLDQDVLWFTDVYSDGLYRYSLESGEVSCVAALEDEKVRRIHQFSHIVAIENEVYLVPLRASKIFCFDKKTSEVLSIDIPTNVISEWDYYNVNRRFAKGFYYNDSIFLVGMTYPAIVQIDVLSKKTKVWNAWLQSALKYCNTEGADICREAMEFEGKIFAPISFGNAVLEFDMQKCSSRIYEVGDESNSYSTICYDGDSFWLSTCDNRKIVKWNKGTNVVQEYPLLSFMETNDIDIFKELVYEDGWIYMLPIVTDRVVRIKKETEELEVLKLEDENILKIHRDENGIKMRKRCCTISRLIDCTDTSVRERLLEKTSRLKEERRKACSEEYKVFHGQKRTKEKTFQENYVEALQDYIEYVCKG